MIRHRRVAVGRSALLLLAVTLAPAGRTASARRRGSRSPSCLPVNLLSSTDDRRLLPGRRTLGAVASSIPPATMSRSPSPAGPPRPSPARPPSPCSPRPSACPTTLTCALSVETGPAHTLTLPAPPLPVATQIVDWGLPEEAGPPCAAPGVGRGPGDLFRRCALPHHAGRPDQRRTSCASNGWPASPCYPVQYDPASRQLTVYEWLRVTVTFSGSSATGSADQATSLPARQSPPPTKANSRDAAQLRLRPRLATAQSTAD